MRPAHLPRMVMFILRVVWALTIFLVEVGCWAVWLAQQLWQVAGDARAARASMKDGELRCPQGHVIPIDEILCQCSACSFVYKGSLLRCENPECGAPTSFVTCPTCGLARRSPYRVGRT